MGHAKYLHVALSKVRRLLILFYVSRNNGLSWIQFHLYFTMLRISERISTKIPQSFDDRLNFDSFQCLKYSPRNKFSDSKSSFDSLGTGLSCLVMFAHVCSCLLMFAHVLSSLVKLVRFQSSHAFAV